jgi:NADH-quinone oxidoreductase subunit I
MVGSEILRGLGVTLKHFVGTYLDDIKWLGKPRYSVERVAARNALDFEGATTVQYPEEKLVIPEEFRYIPFLVYDEGENGEQVDRCTSCGICAKVCPPQCIWIVRTNDPVTGRPIPAPAEFYIDVDICMNCGLCAEFCPFDAIKMDHDFEIAVYDRYSTNIYDKQHLSKPASYYAGIRPVNFTAEEAARKEKEAAKAAAVAAKKFTPPARPTPPTPPAPGG